MREEEIKEGRKKERMEARKKERKQRKKLQFVGGEEGIKN